MTVTCIGNNQLFCTGSEPVIKYLKEGVNGEGGVVQPGCSEEQIDK